MKVPFYTTAKESTEDFFGNRIEKGGQYLVNAIADGCYQINGIWWFASRFNNQPVEKQRAFNAELDSKQIYLCGSLRNPAITPLANRLEKDIGVKVFADWNAAGEHADDAWRDYEKARGFSFKQALARPAAKNVYEFDKKHIDASDVMVLAMPAGKSAFLELGYHLGKGKAGFILLDDPERWDVMMQFATGVADTYEELAEMIGDWYGK